MGKPPKPTPTPAPPTPAPPTPPQSNSYLFGYYGDDLVRVAMADLVTRSGTQGTAVMAKLDEMENIIMALQADVQALVDQVAANTSAEASAVAAFGVLAAQIADLQAQLAAIVPGAAIDPTDLAAIQTQAQLLKDSANALTAAVPQNVVPTPAP